MSLNGLRWAKRVRGVDAFGKSILWSLGDRLDDLTLQVVVDLNRLAEETCIEVTMLRVYLTSLEKQGFVAHLGQQPQYSAGRDQRRIACNVERLEPAQ